MNYEEDQDKGQFPGHQPAARSNSGVKVSFDAELPSMFEDGADNKKKLDYKRVVNQ
jgi:hypothetical protein